MWKAWTDLDLFEVWRRILGITCTVYALVVLSQSLLRWLGHLRSGDGRIGLIARRYVVTRILGVRLKAWWPDLLHIAGLILVLIGLLYAHRWVWPYAE
jgi:hypothetical protein